MGSTTASTALMILKPYSHSLMQKNQPEANDREEESTPSQLEKIPVNEGIKHLENKRGIASSKYLLLC